VDGRPLAINLDFARQVAFLSDQLDVSERHIAGLLHSITEENPNMSPLDCVETAIALFHRRRRDLIHCLVYILDAAAASGAANAPPMYKRVDAFARQHLFASNGATPSLALNILQAIESTGQQLAKAQAAKQAAVSQTVIPSAQGTHVLTNILGTG
jgi:nuclear pore complex protein Nup205